MAAIPVILNGTFTQDNGQSFNGTFQGVMGYSNLAIGGGPIPAPPGVPTHPIVPPGGYPEPGHPIVPPGGYPHPEHPIVLPPYPPGVPTHPIVLPPDQPGHPAHPIVIPDPPVDVPPDVPPGTVVKPPPESGGWGWIAPYGWGYFPAVGDAGPKK